MSSKSKKALRETNQLIDKFIRNTNDQNLQTTPNQKRSIAEVDAATPSPEKNSDQLLNQIRHIVREELQTAVSDFKNTINDSIGLIKEELNDLRAEVKTLKENLDFEKTKSVELQNVVSKLESLNLQNNLVIHNVPSTYRESKNELEAKLLQIFQRCNLFLPPLAITNVERLNQPTKPVRITFHHPKARQLILSNRSLLFKTFKIRVEEDFPDNIRQNRDILIPILKAARQNNHFAILKGDTLQIDNSEYHANSLESLPQYLQPRNITTITKDNVVAFYKKSSPFSNHYPCKFTLDDITYNCAEQAYALARANHAHDHQAAHDIMATNDPVLQKSIMKRLKSNTNDWDSIKYDVMTKIVSAKFQQDPSLKCALSETNEKILVEGNPHDTYWGAGVSIFDKKIWNNKEWVGKNQLGNILMKVRSELN